MAKLSIFPGRVIFHHIAKAAGTALNVWLRQSLGPGCVTEPLIGNHRELISRYGGYSVIFAHLGFAGEGLDPRYQYVTLVRDPVERMISWLYFVINHHTAEELLPEWGWDVWSAAAAFVDSQGETLHDRLVPVLSNEMVSNFASVLSKSRNSEEEQLALALEAIRQYDLVGVYEELPGFTRRLAAMLGLGEPNLPMVNVTQKPQASERLRKRLEELNRLDFVFYREAQVLARAQEEPPSELPPPRWQAWPGFGSRCFQHPCIQSFRAGIKGGPSFGRGEMLKFFLEFRLTEPVDELEPGIHLFDSGGRWAFGINTTLLGKPVGRTLPGDYRLGWNVIADLPFGRYTAGFALSDRSEGRTKELLWYDVLVEFEICGKRRTPSVGYADLPVSFVISTIREPQIHPDQRLPDRVRV